MNTKINPLLVCATLFAGSSGLAIRASDALTAPLSTAAALGASAKLTLGEVRKIDPEQGNLTIKHGPIENHQMPRMTMVFKALF